MTWVIRLNTFTYRYVCYVNLLLGSSCLKLIDTKLKPNPMFLFLYCRCLLYNRNLLIDGVVRTSCFRQIKGLVVGLFVHDTEYQLSIWVPIKKKQGELNDWRTSVWMNRNTQKRIEVNKPTRMNLERDLLKVLNCTLQSQLRSKYKKFNISAISTPSTTFCRNKSLQRNLNRNYNLKP